MKVSLDSLRKFVLLLQGQRKKRYITRIIVTQMERINGDLDCGHPCEGRIKTILCFCRLIPVDLIDKRGREAGLFLAQVNSMGGQEI